MKSLDRSPREWTAPPLGMLTETDWIEADREPGVDANPAGVGLVDDAVDVVVVRAALAEQGASVAS